MASMTTAACGGAAPEPKDPTQTATAPRASIAEVQEARDEQVGISGIEGTLSEYEVNKTMNKRSRLQALAQCQADRMQDVPLLAGAIEVAIHVARDGRVTEATARRSSIGDLATERCILDVVRDARFPRPRGGEADVKWSMAIDERGRGPDRIEARRIRRQLAKRGRALRESCELGGTPVRVTAYVGRSGQVLAVGASALEAHGDEVFDCISDDVKTWRMPKGGRVSKVSFELK